MNKKGIYIRNDYDIREIWVQRNANILEYKLWVIFQINFNKETEKKVLSFLQAENERFLHNNLPKSHEEFINVANEYTNLETISNSLPPRLIAIKENDLNDMQTELVIDENGFIYGDSVGGLSLNKLEVHNEKFLKDIYSVEKILINPGVLARIEIKDGQEKKFVFQLAEKNLQKKMQIFYKPIGGHLKYKNNFESLIKKLNIELKNRDEEQDLHDISLYIKPDKFLEVSNVLKNDLLSKRQYLYIEDPKISIYRELQEEIGPIFASDGISLLDKFDMELMVDLEF